jgi:hypothetical protein
MIPAMIVLWSSYFVKQLAIAARSFNQLTYRTRTVFVLRETDEVGKPHLGDMPSRPLRHSGPETGHQPLAVERDFQCDLKLLFFLRYSIVCLISAPHRHRHGYLRCRNETDATKTPKHEAILAALAEAPRRGAAGARVGNRLSPLTYGHRHPPYRPARRLASLACSGRAKR